jgi:hypothetical protein
VILHLVHFKNFLTYLSNYNNSNLNWVEGFDSFGFHGNYI